MTLVMVPHKAGRDRVSIWVAVSGTGRRPGDIRLTAGQQTATGPSAAWTVVDVGGALPEEYRTTWTQTVELVGLPAGRRHEVTGVVDGLQTSCWPGTLPDALPRKPDDPYTILLASCFASFQDEVGAVGRNVARLAKDVRPHLKLLCGDQVYLDNPWYEILPRNRAGLAKRFLDKYLATWMPSGGHEGLSRLLAEGSTYFLADDHEFWNNHPNWGPLVATRGREARDDWQAVATQLYESFQATAKQDVKQTQRFQLGPLEVWVVDTRFSREEGDKVFMAPDALKELVAWLRDGTTPGVLVLGAPIFTEAAGWFSSRFADRSLANYEQYAELADALLVSRRSLLVLTGDVHFGRFATAKDDHGSRATLVEIAASPLALVDPTVGGAYHAAPSRFPVKAGRVPHSEVHTWQWKGWQESDAGLTTNHFVTLGLHGLDRGAYVRATAWKIQADDASQFEPVVAGWREFTLEEAR